MKNFALFLSILMAGIPYAYVMRSHLDAITALSAINVLTSSLLWPIAVASFISCLPSKKFSLPIGAALLLSQSLILLITKIYHDYFQDFPHIHMLFQHAGEGTTVLGMITTQIMNEADFLVLSIAIISAVLIPLLTPCSVSFRKSLKPFLATVLITVGLCGYVIVVKKEFGDRSISFARNGLILTTRNQLLEMLRPIRTDKPILPKSPQSNGILSEKIKKQKIERVFILQLESLDPDLVGMSVGNIPIAPNLDKLKKECTTFNQFYSQHGGGGSSDAELGALSGLFALSSHGGLSTANHDWLISLPEQLSTGSIDAYFFHSNYSSYYDRGKNYRKMGFKKSFFSTNYSVDNRGWKSSDSQFFKESLSLLNREKPKRSLSYLVTIQSHGPFQQQKLPDPFPLSSKLPAPRGYVRSIYELDLAVHDFFEELKKYSWSKNTAVILFSDHISRVFQKVDPNGHERIFATICGIGKHPELENNLGTHTDISPTVADLFGIAPSPTWLGTSLLRTNVKRKAFMVRAPLLVQKAGESPKKVDNMDEIKPFLDYSSQVLWP